MEPVLRVGVVEDSREDYLAIARILGPSMEVVHWQAAEQALPALSFGQLEEFALIIVDGRLPGMDGPDLVRAIRETPAGGAARLVVLSGLTDPGAARRALEAGADEYVEKGTTLQSLKAAVAKCLGSIVDQAPSPH